MGLKRLLSVIMLTMVLSVGLCMNVFAATKTKTTNTSIQTKEDKYLSELKEAVDYAIGVSEKVEKVTLKDRKLTIIVDISKANDGAKVKFPLEDIALSRASSITDAVLELDTSYWDTIVVDFGKYGALTRTTKDIVNSSYGKYFEITKLDSGEDSKKSLTDTTDNNEYIEKYKSEIVVNAKMSLDRFVSDYKISLAPQNWKLVKFDDKDAVSAMTEITVGGKKIDYFYVGTLNFDNDGKVTGAKPHLLMAGNSILGDDGYCDDFLKKMGIKK